MDWQSPQPSIEIVILLLRQECRRSEREEEYDFYEILSIRKVLRLKTAYKRRSFYTRLHRFPVQRPECFSVLGTLQANRIIRSLFYQPCSALPSEASCRISAIEIIGKNLIKRISNGRNSPIEPANVAQSQNDGLYIPHEDGRKSRCKLVTTIINRSSHIPILI